MSLHDIWQQEFFRQALYASVIVGTLCSFLGVYVVLRRIVFVGMALAQLGAAGTALATFLDSAHTIAFSLATIFGGVTLFSLAPRSRRISPESIIGIAYAFAAAFSILIISKSPHGEEHDLVWHGDPIVVSGNPALFWSLVGLFVVVLLIHLAFFKEFVFTAFDPEMAATVGIKVTVFNVLFYLTLGAVIALSIQAVGVMMVFSMLVMPAAAGLLTSRRMATAFLISTLSGALCSILGLYLAYRFDITAGPTIAATCLAPLALALIWRAVRRQT
jgi:ABC-type Mn2+/Zn2+ transport system permease subunit